MSALPEHAWADEPWLDESCIVFAIGDVEWEPALLSALRHPAIRLNVAKRCLDAIELVAAIETSNAGQAFISAELARLDLEVISRLCKRGIRITGVVDSRDEDQEMLLRQWGIDTIVTIDVQRPGAAAASLASLMKVETTPPARVTKMTVPQELPEPVGRVITVWGPPGSTGKTTIAMNIADEYAAMGQRVLLIDADVDAPSVALMMAIVEAPGGLPVALRRATAGHFDAATLEELAIHVTDNLSVLVGSGGIGHRAQLRSPAFAALRQVACHVFDVVVIDLGCVPLPVEGLGEQASLATLDALDESSEILVVAGPSLVEIQRLIQCIDSLKDTLPHVSPRVVINRTMPRADIAHALATHCRVEGASLTFVPEDIKVMSTCMRDGLTLREVAPRGKTRAYVMAVSQDLLSAGA